MLVNLLAKSVVLPNTKNYTHIPILFISATISRP